VASHTSRPLSTLCPISPFLFLVWKKIFLFSLSPGRVELLHKSNSSPPIGACPVPLPLWKNKSSDSQFPPNPPLSHTGLFPPPPSLPVDRPEPHLPELFRASSSQFCVARPNFPLPRLSFCCWRPWFLSFPVASGWAGPSSGPWTPTFLWRPFRQLRVFDCVPPFFFFISHFHAKVLHFYCRFHDSSSYGRFSLVSPPALFFPPCFLSFLQPSFP